MRSMIGIQNFALTDCERASDEPSWVSATSVATPKFATQIRHPVSEAVTQFGQNRNQTPLKMTAFFWLRIRSDHARSKDGISPDPNAIRTMPARGDSGPCGYRLLDAGKFRESTKEGNVPMCRLSPAAPSSAVMGNAKGTRCKQDEAGYRAVPDHLDVQVKINATREGQVGMQFASLQQHSSNDPRPRCAMF